MLHRSAKHWENPEGFDPTRFEPRAKEGRHKYAYMPFGGGPRTCIGNVFALTEATIVLSMIAQRFRMELLPGHVMELDALVTLRPKGGVPMQVREHTHVARGQPARSRRSLASASVTPLG